MKYKPDWEIAKAKYEAWWRGEELARPLLQVTARLPEKPGTRPPKDPGTNERRFTDIDYAMERTIYEFERTYFAAEAFPCFWPNFGPDFMGAVMGASLEFGENTSWAIPVYESLKGADIKFDENNAYFRRMEAFSREVAKNAPGNYIYGITDLHPSLDALCAICGVENLMAELINEPETVLKALKQTENVFDELYERLLNVGLEYQPGGSTSTLQVWSGGRYFPNVCDVIYMISPEMFDTFARPTIEHELDLLDDTIIHVDGVGSLNHLDSILRLEKLKAVQWVYGEGQPSARHWPEVYKKICESGKMVYVGGPPDDIEDILRVVEPSKLIYATSQPNKERADEYIKWVERICAG